MEYAQHFSSNEVLFEYDFELLRIYHAMALYVAILSGFMCGVAVLPFKNAFTYKRGRLSETRCV